MFTQQKAVLAHVTHLLIYIVLLYTHRDTALHKQLNEIQHSGSTHCSGNPYLLQ